MIPNCTSPRFELPHICYLTLLLLLLFGFLLFFIIQWVFFWYRERKCWVFAFYCGCTVNCKFRVLFKVSIYIAILLVLIIGVPGWFCITISNKLEDVKPCILLCIGCLNSYVILATFRRNFYL